MPDLVDYDEHLSKSYRRLYNVLQDEQTASRERNHTQKQAILAGSQQEAERKDKFGDTLPSSMPLLSPQDINCFHRQLQGDLAKGSILKCSNLQTAARAYLVIRLDLKQAMPHELKLAESM